MRKVIYQYWIEPKESPSGKGYMSEPQSGFFHCFDATMQDARAIIEDVTTGQVRTVKPEDIRFVQPPETRAHKNDVVDIAKAIETVCDKIEMLATVIEGR